MTTAPAIVPESGEHIPIETFADILRAMSRDRALAEAVRQHVLDDELRRLPAAFQQLAATVEDYMAQTNRILAELQAGQTALQAGQDELRAGQLELQAKFLPLDARKMVGVIAGRLNIRRPVWLENTDLLVIADEAGEVADAVPQNEMQSFFAIDLALRAVGKAARDTQYVVIECSNTVDRNDIVRIRRNADLMARFTGCMTHAMVIGNRLPEHIASVAEASGVHSLQPSVRVTRAT